MKKFLILFALTCSLSFAQDLKSYKYALVPAKFAALKEPDQYRLNTLLKLFMQQKGFETYIDNIDAPEDFVNSNCNKVFVDLADNSTAFTTKIIVVLKDCKGKVLFNSEEGSSRDKDNEIAYNQALRMTFPSLSRIRQSPLNALDSKSSLDVKATPSTDPVAEPIADETLTVKKTANGYEIFDSNSKLVFSLFNTSVKEIFMAKKDTVQGIVYKAEDHWFFEHYRGNKLLTEVIAVTLK